MLPDGKETNVELAFRNVDGMALPVPNAIRKAGCSEGWEDAGFGNVVLESSFTDSSVNWDAAGLDNVMNLFSGITSSVISSFPTRQFLGNPFTFIKMTRK